MLRVQKRLTTISPEAKLYVSYMNTFQSIGETDNLDKWINRGESIKDLFRVKGLDPSLYMNKKNIVVSRPVRIGMLSENINAILGKIYRLLTQSTSYIGKVKM